MVTIRTFKSFLKTHSICFLIFLIHRRRRRMRYITRLHQVIFQMCCFILRNSTRETGSRGFNMSHILPRYTFSIAIFGEPHFVTAYFFLFQININTMNTLVLTLAHIRIFYVPYCPCI